MRSTLVVAGALLCWTGTVRSQQQPTGYAVTLAPSYSRWRFADAIPQDSLLIKSAGQLSIPVSFALQFMGGNLRIDAGAAYATGRITLDDGRSFDLSGLTDAKVRAVAHVIGDRLLVTLGFTAPIGATHLSGREIDALAVLGSPALGFATPVLGNGPGGTGGLVYAFRAGGWGIGVGSSLEIRGQYTPLEAQIAGASSPADLKPGKAYRFSLGADRLVGNGRVSLLLAGDLYGTSHVEIASGTSPVSRQYKLGPQLTANALFELGVPGFRSFAISVSDRYRTKYSGSNGEKAAGSSGNILQASLGFVTGRGQGLGLSLRVDGLLDSGLEVDNTITTAAMTSGGVSLGLFVPVGRAVLQPFVRGQLGKLDTGPNSTTATGLGGGIVLTVRP